MAIEHERSPGVAAAEDDPNVANSGYASPACFMHEVDPAYFDATATPRAEVLAALDGLLDAVRSRERAARRFAAESGSAVRAQWFLRAGETAARWRAMLECHRRRFGGEPGGRRGASTQSAGAPGGDARRVAFLQEGNRRLAEAMTALIPGLRDATLEADLGRMRREVCRGAGDGPAADRPASDR